MYFNKQHYASNFEYVRAVSLADAPESGVRRGTFTTTDFQPAAAQPFQSRQMGVTLTDHGNDIYSLKFDGKGWETYYSQAGLDFAAASGGRASSTKLTLGAGLDLTLTDKTGAALLRSVPGLGFGVSGNAALFQFLREDELQFYGMGEKVLGLELSGKRVKFWNTDLWADFDGNVCRNGNADPLYVSIPYLIVKRGNTYLGLLLDNPFATFMSTNNSVSISNQSDAESKQQPSIILGSEMSQPNLVILAGPTLAELTRKFQKLVGCTPRPPAWALGYHQCRWGYMSVDDLRYLNAGMIKHEVPCDGLWLDIDYMRGFRVFTWDQTRFPNPEANLAEIQATGRRVVPIIDPGVKAEPGYDVYESGKQVDAFCRNPQGKDFIGLVWPGETAFPDFSLPEVRAWWADWVKKFAEQGITAAWLDMNDPSTGFSLCTEMLFNRGKDNHNSYHNQYAFGMAQASREGFQSARPQERPFLLCRSGSTGIGKHTAIWCGDNTSNYHWLKGSIPCSLNLALSGVPFNGADVAGFGSSTNEKLMIDWVKAAFLTPFMRNHTAHGTHAQEPWAFDETVLRIFRRFVQMRYTLRPYLYNLFIRQSEEGEAIMRPLFYDFEDTAQQPLGKIEDQFMVGPSVMQAPFVVEDATQRQVVLPAADWYDSETGTWLAGGQTITITKQLETTPLYIRGGSILPLARNTGADFSYKGAEVDFAIFLPAGKDGSAKTSYVFDDGIGYGYKEGKQSEVEIQAAITGNTLTITAKQIKDGFGTCDAAFLFTGAYDKVLLNGRAVEPERIEKEFAGRKTIFFRVR